MSNNGGGSFVARVARMTASAGVMLGVALHAHTMQPPAQQTPRAEPPLRASILRGEYGPYRANNDVLFYHLDVRLDPDKKFISG